MPGIPNPSADFFAAQANEQTEQPLLDDLKQMLRNHANNHGRHLQRALGPSQVGHPCARQVIQGMLELPRINPQFDPLPSYIGVAAHAAMEDAARLANDQLVANGGKVRWIPEQKVPVSPYVPSGGGTADLYDVETHTVIDYKFPGPTQMTKYRKDGPHRVYRTQAQLYGRGYRNLGFPVKRVGIWFLPRGGQLATSLLWETDYDDALVERELERLRNFAILMNDLELEQHPERLAMLPVDPSDCQWCPFWTVRQNHPDPTACTGQGYSPVHTDREG